MKTLFTILGAIAVAIFGGWLIHKYVPTGTDSTFGRAKDRVVEILGKAKDAMTSPTEGATA